MTEVLRFNSREKNHYQAALRIRHQVFVEEQGVPEELEYDAHEDQACHYLLLLNGQAVATARWRETKKGIKLERFAVLSAYRNLKIGGKILQSVMEDILPMGKRIYLHSQLRAVPFYERNGFIKEGEAFTEAGITHFRMFYSET